MSNGISIQINEGNRISVEPSTVEEIINGDTRRLVEVAEGLGMRFSTELGPKERVSTGQIRNIYGTVKRMESRGFEESELLLLKPRLAFVARKNIKGLKELSQVLTWAIDSVGNEGQFLQFVRFFEAILAYHQAQGGK